MVRKIYATHWDELGDCWAVVSALVDLSLWTNAEVYLSSFAVLSNRNLRARFEEIMSVMDMSGARIRIVEEPKNADLNGHPAFGVFHNPNPYARTKIRWNSKKVKAQACHQLESRIYENGRYTAIKPNWANAYKLIPAGELEQIDRLFAGADLEMIHLGKHFSLEECIRVAAESRFFIGICSGMSHLCHSVGVPTFLYHWQGEGDSAHLDIRDFHKAKRFELFRTVDEVRHILRGGYLDYRG